MKSCKLIIKDEVNIKLEDVPVNVRRKLASAFKYEIPGARFTPAYKLGQWDGTQSYFGIGGDGFLNHLDKISNILNKEGYQIEEIVDQRNVHDLKMDDIGEDFWGERRWPKGHPIEGELIRLRDYQVNVVNSFLRNPQSLQSVATGSGKCLSGKEKIKINISRDSPVFDCFDTDQNGDTIVSFYQLSQIIEEYYNFALIDQVGVSLKDFKITIDAPLVCDAKVMWFVKKENLPAVTVHLEDGRNFTCSEMHGVIMAEEEVTVTDLKPGDVIEGNHSPCVVSSVCEHEPIDCYDITVDSPHVYYDAQGIAHHNTIITATLSKCVEKHGRSLVIVPNKSLVTQTYADYDNCGLDVGVYYGDKKETDKMHTICTWQSLMSLNKAYKSGKSDISLADLTDGVECVIIDECHKIAGKQLKDMLTRDFRFVPIRWGLTGTIPKEDHNFQALHTSVGPVINQVNASDLQDLGVLSQCHVNIKQLIDIGNYRDYPSEQKYLLTSPDRIEFISEYLKNNCLTGNTLILVDRVTTGEMISEVLECDFVYGSMKNSDRKEIYDKINEGENEFAVATYGVASTGISIANLHHVVLLEPGKSFIKVIQSIGRGLRKSKTKDFVNIWDITSTCKFSKRHLTERKKFYKEAGYKFTIEKIDWT